MALRYRCLIFAVLAVLFVGALSEEKSAWADEAYDSEELEFLEILNQYRKDNGRGPLILSDALTKASERHSKDMGRYRFFDHPTIKSSYFPEGSRPWDRMARSGYDYNASMAENLAAGHETAEKAFEAWRNSPGHNANMIDGNQRVIGIARVQVPDSEYDWYWTTDFGSEVDPTAHEPGESPSSERKETEEKREIERKEASEQRRTSEKANRDRGGIENGTMTEDAVWEQESAKKKNNLIDEGVARLGGYDNAEDEISQRIQVRKGQRLSYRVRTLTKESEHPADGLVVRLTDMNGRHLATIDKHTDADAEKPDEDGWIRDTADLSRFAGRTVKLSFFVKTDEERPTVFYVDDVAIE